MKRKIIIIILICLIVLDAGFITFMIVTDDGGKNVVMEYDDYYKDIDITNEANDKYDLTSDEYYNKYYKIVSKIKANKSKKVMSVKEVKSFLDKRGFKDYELKVNYSIDGEFIYKKDIEDEEDEKYPMYEIYYASTDSLWTVYIVEDSIYAYPASYVLDNMYTIKKDILISETSDTVVYSSDDNTFYTIKPNKNLIDVRLVKTINASTLDKYSFE